MNRRKFIGTLSASVAAVAVAPLLPEAAPAMYDGLKLGPYFADEVGMVPKYITGVDPHHYSGPTYLVIFKKTPDGKISQVYSKKWTGSGPRSGADA